MIGITPVMTGIMSPRAWCQPRPYEDRSAPTAAPFVPRSRRVSALSRAANSCKGCNLFKGAIQAVFGEVPAPAKLMIVGEVPGDVEDRSGRPFVGPAGMLLERALREAGLERSTVYIKNAVKHFKFVQRGERRIHQKPKMLEIQACRPWLEAEMQAVKPQLILCLGRTAAQALLGRKFLLTKNRGRFVSHPGGFVVLATPHPAAIHRMPDPEEREKALRQFLRDVRAVRRRLD
jgi:DNA polymerase